MNLRQHRSGCVHWHPEVLSEWLRSAFDPAEDFTSVPGPKPGDWLAEHRETGQSFEQFLWSQPNRRAPVHRKLYLLPLGDFPTDRTPAVPLLQEVTEVFFALPATVLPAVPLDPSRVTTRIHR